MDMLMYCNFSSKVLKIVETKGLILKLTEVQISGQQVEDIDDPLYGNMGGPEELVYVWTVPTQILELVVFPLLHCLETMWIFYGNDHNLAVENMSFSHVKWRWVKTNLLSFQDETASFCS